MLLYPVEGSEKRANRDFIRFLGLCHTAFARKDSCEG
jgi:hypothetical protein